MFFNVVTTDPKNESSEIRNYFCDIFMTHKNHKWQEEVLCLQLICTIYETTLLKSAQHAALKKQTQGSLTFCIFVLLRARYIYSLSSSYNQKQLSQPTSLQIHSDESRPYFLLCQTFSLYLSSIKYLSSIRYLSSLDVFYFPYYASIQIYLQMLQTSES